MSGNGSTRGNGGTRNAAGNTARDAAGAARAEAGIRIGRDTFATDDPEAAREYIDLAYGASTRLRGMSPDSTLSHARVDVGPFTLDRAVLPGDLRFASDPHARMLISTPASGVWEADCEGREERPAPGEPLLIPAGTGYLAHVHSTDMHVVSMDPRVLHEAGGTVLDRHAEPVRFSGLRPADLAGAELWRATAAFVAAQLSMATHVSPLAVSGMARLLASVALAVFPNEVEPEPTRTDGHDGTLPATVRRAVAFIEAHADRDVALSEIADAAGVTPRALQYAFRRHLGTTPLGYLRTVRLDLVHRDLRAGGVGIGGGIGASGAPAAGITVTQVAGRWGFWHPGRFAAQYRAVYGCSPSETLSAAREGRQRGENGGTGGTGPR